MKTVSANELCRIIESPQRVPVINVLDLDAYEKRRIPESVSVPLSAPNFEDKIEEQVFNKSDPVVVYCASVACDASERAAERLEHAGYVNVIDFADGIEGWACAGYRLEGEQPSIPT